MAENRKLKVFLCHSKGDKSKVRKLYKRLIVDGFDAWLDDEKLMPGQDWDFEIQKAVRNADTVIVFLSKDSVTKEGYIQKEISFALDVASEKPEGTIFLIPARMEDCEVPHRLSKYQWVDLFSRKGYQKLIETLRMRMNDLRIRFKENEIINTKFADFIKIPIIGNIITNHPISPTLLSNSSVTDTVEISPALLPYRTNSSNLFALNVVDDSMSDAMIDNKDIVIMSPTTEVKNGEMVAVWLSKRNETALRYFYKEKDGYRLQPANPMIKPILISKEEPIEIKGKVVMVIRKVKI